MINIHSDNAAYGLAEALESSYQVCCIAFELLFYIFISPPIVREKEEEEEEEETHSLERRSA
jgi:hypothetical protein